MPRPQMQGGTQVRPFFPSRPRTCYWVLRQEDVWFISFNGDEYGPYKSEREAMLFAVDAANKLGEQGEETQVLVMDENGDAQPAWTFGQDFVSAKALGFRHSEVLHRLVIACDCGR